MFIILQTSSDGNTTTSTLSFIASKEDTGKYLSCRAENPVVNADGLEDGWRLEIQCKYFYTFIYFHIYKMYIKVWRMKSKRNAREKL